MCVSLRHLLEKGENTESQGALPSPMARGLDDGKLLGEVGVWGTEQVGLRTPLPKH